MKDFGPTVLRIFVGVIFVMHSYLALFVFTPAGSAEEGAGNVFFLTFIR